MILAAGVGSRLDPLTRNVPKPMVPIVNQPVMEHLVRLLVKHGFTEIAANTHYLADQIESYFNDGASLGAQMRFNRESELLGTAGGVRRVADSWNYFQNGETFLVTGGDDFTDMDISAMLAFHRENRAMATIGLASVEDPSQFGVVVLEDMNSARGGAIASFVEKPPAGTAPSNLVNTGVYLFEAEVLELIPAGEFYDFGKQLFPLLLEQGKPFFGFKTDGYWRDVGNLQELREAHDDFFEGKVNIAPNVPTQEKDIWIGENCTIHPTARIEAPVVIGPNCTVGAHSRIAGGSFLGEGVVVADGATVNHSILWARAHVEPYTYLDGCIVGFDCHVGSNAGIFGGTVVSPHKK